MKMKLLLENWRKFLDEERKAQELLKEETSCPPNQIALPDGTCFRDPLHVASPDSMRSGPEIKAVRGREMSSKKAADKTKAALTRDKMKRAHHRMSGGPSTPEAKEVARVVASMGDPTGVLSYPDVKDAYMDYQNNPSKASMGWLFVAIVAAIPIVGYTVKPLKVARLAKLTKTVNKADAAFTAAVKAKKPGALQAQKMMAARTGKSAEGAQVASKTARISGDLMKVERIEAMVMGHGQSYVIVKTKDGPMAFYKSSATAYSDMGSPWIPMFGVNGGNDFMKLSGAHKDALEFVAKGKKLKGKYAVEGSEINNIGKALEKQGAFKGAPRGYNSVSHFLSDNINSLRSGMSMEQIVAQLNRGLRKMGRGELNLQTVENVGINLHLKLHGVNTKLTGMAGSGIPGVNSVINQSDFIEALNLGRGR